MVWTIHGGIDNYPGDWRLFFSRRIIPSTTHSIHYRTNRFINRLGRHRMRFSKGPVFVLITNHTGRVDVTSAVGASTFIGESLPISICASAWARWFGVWSPVQTRLVCANMDSNSAKQERENLPLDIFVFSKIFCIGTHVQWQDRKFQIPWKAGRNLILNNVSYHIDCAMPQFLSGGGGVVQLHVQRVYTSYNWLISLITVHSPVLNAP